MSDSSEFAPLSPLDELPIHQVVEPVRFVATTDPRAFERYWFTAQEADGSVFLVTGFGFYPNLGKADAYAIFVHDGRQTSVRCHRSLALDRSFMQVGPFSATPVTAFREWRLTLDDNPQRFSFDLRWRDTKRAVFSRMSPPAIPGELNGRLLHDWGGYETFGTIEGTVTVGGNTFALNPATVRGSRDHHWGVRNGVGGERFLLGASRSSHCGQWVEFREWSIWGNKILFNLGDPRAGALRVAASQHRLRFDPLTKHFKGGIISNRLENGQIKELHYEVIANQTAYMRCGMYTGPDGRGTPQENHHHGQLVGDRLDADSYDLTDPSVRMAIGGFEDHLCRVRCDGETVVGILECRNPVLYEMCLAERPGYTLLSTESGS